MNPDQLFLKWRFFIACVIVAVLSYFYTDISVARFVHHDLSGHARAIFTMLTLPGKAIYPLLTFLVLGLLAKFVFKNNTITWVCVYIILAIIVSGLICDIFKICLARARPQMLFSNNLYGFYGFKLSAKMWSFPSGHSTTLGSIAMALALCFRRFAWVFIVVGFILACCRVLASAHYPSDVIAGFYLGALSSILLYQTQWLQRKLRDLKHND